MKKKIIGLLLAVLVVAAGYVIYMEIHFSTTTSVPVKLSSEQILNEMPDIAFTEQDTTMFKELLAAQELAEAFLLASENENGIYVLPLDVANELLKISRDFLLSSTL